MTRFAALGLLLAFGGAATLYAQGPGRGRRGQQQAQAIQQIVPGLYLVTGAGANSVFRIANEGLLLVDTKNLGQANYDALLAQIKTVSDKPVKNVVIGDVHQDKSGNTTLFVSAGAQVIAHENEKKGLETYTNPAFFKQRGPLVHGRRPSMASYRPSANRVLHPLPRRVQVVKIGETRCRDEFCCCLPWSSWRLWPLPAATHRGVLFGPL
jgi:glyoxylase-like metal-dependent hydrolase (beta-lactamase superfamily II)